MSDERVRVECVGCGKVMLVDVLRAPGEPLLDALTRRVAVMLAATREMVWDPEMGGGGGIKKESAREYAERLYGAAVRDSALKGPLPRVGP